LTFYQPLLSVDI